MGFEETHCVIIRCDKCQAALGHEDAGVAHFDSREVALLTAIECGWLEIPTGLVCKDCITSESCAAMGHEWNDWHKVSYGSYEGRKRFCKTCPAQEYDPPIAT